MASGIQTSRLPGLLFALAILSTLPILWLIVRPMLTGAGWPQHAEHLPIVLLHVGGGLAMLGLGSAALYIGWTRKAFRRHKWFGYSYLLLGGIGALAALIVSIQAPHPPRSLYIATGTLALAWLAVAAMAWRAARNRRFEEHRQWMVRSYVLTWSFVLPPLKLNAPAACTPELPRVWLNPPAVWNLESPPVLLNKPEACRARASPPTELNTPEACSPVTSPRTILAKPAAWAASTLLAKLTTPAAWKPFVVPPT